MTAFCKRICTAIFFLLVSSSLQSQSLWIPYTEKSSVSLEFVKASFNNSADYTFFTGVYVLGGRFVVSPMTTITADIPFTSFSSEHKSLFSSTTYENQGSAIGNPRIAIELKPANTDFYVEAGLNVPAADAKRSGDNDRSDALIYGVYTDPDRIASFSDNYFPVFLQFSFTPKISKDNSFVRIRAGVLHFIPDVNASHALTYANWSVQLFVLNEEFQLGGGYSAILRTDEKIEFDEASVHQLGFFFGVPINRYTPALAVRLPLNKSYSDIVHYVFDLSVTYRW